MNECQTLAGSKSQLHQLLAGENDICSENLTIGVSNSDEVNSSCTPPRDSWDRNCSLCTNWQAPRPSGKKILL